MTASNQLVVASLRWTEEHVTTHLPQTPSSHSPLPMKQSLVQLVPSGLLGKEHRTSNAPTSQALLPLRVHFKRFVTATELGMRH